MACGAAPRGRLLSTTGLRGGRGRDPDPGAGAAGEDGRARTAEGGREGGPGESKNTTRGSGGGGVAEKRVRNDRIKRELGVRLMFPTYREGLAAIARGDATPFGADER